MAKNTGEVRNEIIEDVELFWAKLHTPVEPFGEPQYEIQLRFGKDRVEELEQYGKVKPVKDEKNRFQLNLKKKAFKVDGSEAAKVKLVDTNGDAVDPRTLGNGSTGNVKVMLKDYEIKNKQGKVTKTGTQVMLIAVQVTDMVVYEPKSGVDFSYNASDEDEEEEVAAPAKKSTSKPAAKQAAAKTPVKPATKAKAAGKTSKKSAADEEDDQIPF